MHDPMEPILAIFITLLVLLLFIMLIRWPIKVAIDRGIPETTLGTIKVFSWLSLLLGITWFIAMIVALLAEPQIKTDHLDKLEKLNKLRKSKAISESEYQKEKKKILK